MNDHEIKAAFKSGLEGFKSDSVDFILEHSPEFPISIVLFYDENIYLESIMNSLACKLMDVFIYKFKFELQRKNYKDFTPQNSIFTRIALDPLNFRCDWSENPGTTFESALPLVFEDTLVEYIKQLFISMSGMGL